MFQTGAMAPACKTEDFKSLWCIGGLIYVVLADPWSAAWPEGQNMFLQSRSSLHLEEARVACSCLFCRMTIYSHTGGVVLQAARTKATVKLPPDGESRQRRILPCTIAGKMSALGSCVSFEIWLCASVFVLVFLS